MAVLSISFGIATILGATVTLPYVGGTKIEVNR